MTPPGPDRELLYLNEKDRPDREHRFRLVDALVLGWIILTIGAAIVGTLWMVGYISDQGSLGLAHRWCLSLAPDYPQPPTVMPPNDLGGGY